MEPNDLTVLVIDDSADTLTVLDALLSEVMPRVQLLTAREGASGLELARTRDPDVILLDLLVPSLDAFEVCRRLKDDERTEPIPVVFLSSTEVDRRNRMRALAVGAEGFLSKPVDALELEVQVRAMAKIKACNTRRHRESQRLADMVLLRTRQLEQEFDERRRAEQDYRTLFREMREGFAVHEMVYDDQRHAVDYRFLAVNPAFERLTGLVARDLVGRSVREALPGLEPSWIETFARVVETGEPVVFEDFTAALGRHFSVSAYRPAPGQFACVFTDVSDREREARERKALESRLRQQQKLEALGTLAGGVAHEINNPLAIILSCAELIGDGAPAGSTIAQNAAAIVEATERVGKIVRSLLSFARQDREVVATVRVEQVVESTVSLIRKLLERERIASRIDLDGDLPAVRGRQGALAQVLMNLLTNARDAVNQRWADGGEKRLGVSARSLERDGRRWVRLVVEDNGAGVPDGARDRIFDPFFTTKPAEVGTGLGLSISHGIVQEHGGRIWYEPREEGGARFVVDLPGEGS